MNPNNNNDDEQEQQIQRRRGMGKQKRGVGTRLPDAKDVQSTPASSGSLSYGGGEFR
jgi:hypothetical protein